MYEDFNAGDTKKSEESDDSETWSYSYPSYSRFTFTGKTKSRLGRNNKLTRPNKDGIKVKEDMYKNLGSNNASSSFGITASSSQVPKTPGLSWLNGDGFSNQFTPGTSLLKHSKNKDYSQTNFIDSGIDVSSQSNFFFNLKSDSAQNMNCKQKLAFNNTPYKAIENQNNPLKDINQFLEKPSFPKLNFTCGTKEENKENSASDKMWENVKNKESAYFAPSWNQLKKISDDAITNVASTTKTTETANVGVQNTTAREPFRTSIFSPMRVYNKGNEQKTDYDDHSNTPLDLSSGESLANKNIFSRSVTDGSDHTPQSAEISAIVPNDFQPQTEAILGTTDLCEKSNDVNSKSSDGISSIWPSLVPINKCQPSELGNNENESPPTVISLRNHGTEFNNGVISLNSQTLQKPPIFQSYKNESSSQFSTMLSQDIKHLKSSWPETSKQHKLTQHSNTYKETVQSNNLMKGISGISQPTYKPPCTSASPLLPVLKTDVNSQISSTNYGVIISKQTSEIESIPSKQIGNNFRAFDSLVNKDMKNTVDLKAQRLATENQSSETKVEEKEKVYSETLKKCGDPVLKDNNGSHKCSNSSLILNPLVHGKKSQENSKLTPITSINSLSLNEKCSTNQCSSDHQDSQCQKQSENQPHMPSPQLLGNSHIKKNENLDQALIHGKKSQENSKLTSITSINSLSLNEKCSPNQCLSDHQDSQCQKQSENQPHTPSPQLLGNSHIKKNENLDQALQRHQTLQPKMLKEKQVASSESHFKEVKDGEQIILPQKQVQSDKQPFVSFNRQSENIQQQPHYNQQKTYLAPKNTPDSRTLGDFPHLKPEIPQNNNRMGFPVMDKPQNNFKMAATRGRLSRAHSELYVNNKEYTILSMLGRGGSSEVYQVLDPQSSKLMAVKCVDLSMVDRTIADGYLNEIDLLSKLQGCTSVIRMFDHEYAQELKTLYVVMEKGDTDLSQLIRDISKTKKISMSMIIYYWTEMLTAVQDIHNQGIIHSDLKPANFLLVSGRLKLIDFGIASSQGDMTSVVKEVTTGTWNYMSPEAIRNTSSSGKGFKITYKSDVWSLGCILYNLVYGKTPFSHITNTWGKLQAIADPNHCIEFPDVGAPVVLAKALQSCFHRDPKQRPTVTELLSLQYHAMCDSAHLGQQLMTILPNECWLQVSHLFPEIKALYQEDKNTNDNKS